MLKINQIYKVKEGHEGRCRVFKNRNGKYVEYLGEDDYWTTYFNILDKDKKLITDCVCCFTEDDLELEEEVKEIEFKNDGCFNVQNNLVNTVVFDIKGIEILKLTHDEFFYKGEKVEDIHNVYERFNEWLSIHNPKSLSLSEAETLLEEKLGYKVKIK